MNKEVKVIEECYCGYCMSDDVKRIREFKGEQVIPEDKYDDSNTGIVVQCNKCDEITGFLVILTGVVPDE